MGTDYCLIWKHLVDQPENYETLAAARAAMPNLLNHIEECDRCADWREKSKRLAVLYRALAGKKAPIDAKFVEELLEARADDDRKVEEAVLTALLRASRNTSLALSHGWIGSSVIRTTELPMTRWELRRLGKRSDRGVDLAAFEKAVSEISKNKWRKTFLVPQGFRRCARTLFQGMNAVGMVIENALRRTKRKALFTGMAEIYSMAKKAWRRKRLERPLEGTYSLVR